MTLRQFSGRFGERRDVVALKEVVVVQEEHPVAVAGYDSCVARAAGPVGDVVSDDFDVGEFTGEHPRRAVGGSFVDDHDLDVRPRLGPRAAQRMAQAIAAISRGHYDRNFVAQDARLPLSWTGRRSRLRELTTKRSQATPAIIRMKIGKVTLPASLVTYLCY